MSKEAMTLALEALKLANGMLERADCSTGYCCCGSSFDDHTIGDGHSPLDEGEYFQLKAIRTSKEAIKALEEALKQERGEPVAARFELYHHIVLKLAEAGCKLSEQQKMVLCNLKAVTKPQPAQKPWVGLTNDEIMDMYNEPRSDDEMIAFGREVEAKLKEKNGT